MQKGAQNNVQFVTLNSHFHISLPISIFANYYSTQIRCLKYNKTIFQALSFSHIQSNRSIN